MEKTKITVNGQNISIGVKIIADKGNFKGIANINFGWFEVVGFRISYFKDYTRRDDYLKVEPPKYGKYYNEAFRTTVAIVDINERERVRKKYWYELEDAIIDAYYWSLNKENNFQKDEISLDNLSF